MPGTFFITSQDTDGSSTTSTTALREFVEFIGPTGSGRAGTTALVTTTPAVAGGVNYSVGASNQSVNGITIDPRHKASATYTNVSSFRLVGGAIQGTAACSGTTCERLSAYSFQIADSVYATPIVDGYKSVRLTTDADSSGSVTAGDTLTWTVTYVNTGNSNVSNFQINDTLPGNVTFTPGTQVITQGGGSAAPPNTAYNGTTNTGLLAANATLGVNSTVTVSIPVVVGAGAAGTTLSNQASAAGTGLTATLSDSVDSTTVFPPLVTASAGWTAPAAGSVAQTQTSAIEATRVAVVASPYNLTVSKTDGQTSVVTGASTTYTVRVTNSGTASTAGATLSDPTATGLTVTGVTCSAAVGNTCSAAPTTAQIQGTPGVALPTLAPGAFYEVQLTATVTAAAGANVTNTVTAALATGQNDAVPGDNTASDTNSVTATPPPPASNPTSYPATCDVIDWATSGVSGTALSGTRTFNSKGGRSINLNLTSATGGTNGISGYSGTFANYGSWYEVRAISESIQPVINQAFLTRAGGAGNPNNTIVITFPTPVINVRLGITDLDAVGGSAGSGDWAGVQASYGSQTFNPDVLVGGGHALAVQAYAGVPSGAGAAMTVSVPGLGNSQMRAASASPTFNTLMGIDAAYGTQVSGVNRQGQGVVYFKGPLTSITLTTGSLKGTVGQAIGFSNIDFCPPSVAVDKAAGTPVRQADTSSDIPYTLTYRNTSPNVGYHPDATVRDATFSPSIPTPTGADPWARQRPQLTDAVLDQIRANTNVASATLRGTPTVSGATNTVNLDATDLSPAFSGTAANPNLLLANTDGRVDVGGSFSVNFTVNVRLGSAVTTPQTVNNQATATGTLLTGSVSATSNSVGSTVSPSAALSVTKAVDRTHAVYPSPVGNAEPVPPTLTYTITVSNPGQLTATGVTLTDTLPAGLTGVVVREGAATVSATQAGQTLTWTVGSLPSGTTRTFTVTATAPAAATLRATQPQTALVNSVTASASNVAATPPATVSTPTVYTRLFKQVRNLGPQGTLTPAWGTSASGRPGDVLEYCIDFNNYGSAALSNFSLTDNVAANTTGQPNAYGTGQGVRITRGAAAPTYQAFSNPVVVNLGTLGTAESGQVCFRAGVR
ncbi:beta strand repeat-containing protein [Deinococcus reticulitermitis]|uniref:beta strand repeat-containing protein n=1 Tax=Deinococcus reticulitermitis TaxID=856736 RepID=UPI0015A61040|nr:DUF11 domain-containing protein [Deinococcus reticulitermitis]